jgi:hypothetical protein
MQKAWIRSALWLLFALVAARTVHAAWQWDADTLPRQDFLQIHAGARCLLHHVNPYDTHQLEREFLSSGGLPSQVPNWNFQLPLYPPSALLFGLPFALFNFAHASDLWFALNTVLLLLAFASVHKLVPESAQNTALLLTTLVLAHPGTMLSLGMGQPSALAASTLVLAVYFATRTQNEIVIQKWLPSLLLAVSLATKPQLAVLAWLYCVITPRYRRIAAHSAAVTAVLLAVATCTLRHTGWRGTLHSNVVLAMSATGSNNPAPANPIAYKFFNLQTVTSLIAPNPHAYNALAWAITGATGLWLLFAILRFPLSANRDRLAFAATTALALLPAYHLIVDAPVLVLLVPATVALLSTRRIAGILVTLAALPSTYWYLQLHIVHRLHGQAALGVAARLVLLRQLPISLLLTTILLTWQLWATER